MMLYAQRRAAGHSKLKEDEVGMVSRKKEDCRGKRMLSLLVALTMALLFALAGCSMEGEDTDVDWLSYRLTLAELREMDSSESFQEVVFSTNSGSLSIRQLGTDDMLGNDTRLIDPPAGSRYVVARLLSAEGKLLLEDITNEAVGTVHLRRLQGIVSSRFFTFYGASSMILLLAFPQTTSRRASASCSSCRKISIYRSWA